MNHVRVSVAVLAACSAALALGQQFQNGGFETPNVGTNQWIEGSINGSQWQFVGTSGIANGNSSWGYRGHSGQQYGFLQTGNGTSGAISQTVSGFQVGRTYQVTFWMARRGANAGSTGMLPTEVLLNGLSVIFPPTSPVGDYQWYQYASQPFVATQTSNTFTWTGITNGSDLDSIIDDISFYSPWAMDRADRYGTGKALVGPNPANLTTPWVFQKLSPGVAVSHAPSLGMSGTGYYGEWSTGNVIQFDSASGAALNSFSTGQSRVQSSPAIDSIGNAVIHAAPTLYSLTSNLTGPNWTFGTGATFVDNYNAASPVLGPNDDVVFGSTNGTISRINHTTGGVVWTQGLQFCDHSVAFSRDDSAVFVSNGTSLTALSFATGAILWSQDYGAATGTPAVNANGSVVFGTALGAIFDVNPANGNLNWVQPANAGVSGSAAFNGNNVYIGSQDGNLYSFDVATGNLLWNYQTPAPIDAAPVVGADGSIYLFNRAGDLYRLAANGSVVWHEVIPGGATGSISIGPDGTLYVPNGAGTGLYVIRQQALSPVSFTSGTLDFGTTISGSFQSVQAQDSVDWIIRTIVPLIVTQPGVRVVFGATMPVNQVASFNLRLVSSASSTGLLQTVEALDVTTGAWVQVDQRSAPTSDQSILVSVGPNPTRFVNQSTGQVQIRVAWRAIAATSSISWFAKIDQARIEGVVPAFHP